MKIPGVVFKGAFILLFYLILPYGVMATIPTQFFSGTLSPWGLAYAIAVAMPSQSSPWPSGVWA